MNDPILLEMEQRVRHLKEQVRQLRARRSNPFLLGLIVLGGFFLGLLGWVGLTPVTAQPGKEATRPLKVLEAPVDIQGKDKKTLVRIADDPPTLTLVGPKGYVRLTITDKGGAVSIRGDSSISSAFCFDTNGDGLLSLAGKNGQPIAELGRKGAASFESGGTMIARLGPSQSKASNGYLSLSGKDGNAMVEAGVLGNRGIVRCFPFDPQVGEMLEGNTFVAGAKK